MEDEREREREGEGELEHGVTCALYSGSDWLRDYLGSHSPFQFKTNIVVSTHPTVLNVKVWDSNCGLYLFK